MHHASDSGGRRGNTPAGDEQQKLDGARLLGLLGVSGHVDMSAITWTSYLDLVRFTDVVDVRRLKSFEARNAAFCDGNASETMSVTTRRWYRPDARVTARLRLSPRVRLGEVSVKSDSLYQG